MSDLKEIEKSLGTKKTKEALSQSLSGTFGTGLRELGSSLKSIFTSDAGPSTSSYEKNQITKVLEKFEKKRSAMRSFKKPHVS